MPLSAGSAFICAMTSSGRSFALFKSKITSEGRVSRMRGRTISGMRSKNTGAASALAAVEILIEKIRSSTMHRIMSTPNAQRQMADSQETNSHDVGVGGSEVGVDTIVAE